MLLKRELLALDMYGKHSAKCSFEDAPVNLRPDALQQRVDKGELGVATGKGFYDYAGRGALELQHARDVRLWQVVRALGELVTDPRPI